MIYYIMNFALVKDATLNTATTYSLDLLSVPNIVVPNEAQTTSIMTNLGTRGESRATWSSQTSSLIIYISPNVNLNPSANITVDNFTGNFKSFVNPGFMYITMENINTPGGNDGIYIDVYFPQENVKPLPNPYMAGTFSCSTNGVNGPMISGQIFTAFSGFRFYFGTPPLITNGTLRAQIFYERFILTA